MFWELDAAGGCVNARRPPRGVNGRVSGATTFNNELDMPEFSIVATILI